MNTEAKEIVKKLGKINNALTDIRVQVLGRKDTELIERSVYEIEQSIFRLMDECECKPDSDTDGGLHLAVVSNNEVAVCAHVMYCRIKNKDGSCRKNCKHRENKQTDC